MGEKASILRSLIDVDDSVLIVIDVQERFVAKLPAEERDPLVSRVAWLVGVATKLDVPVVVTAEDIQKLGGIAPAVAERLPDDTQVYDKLSLGLAGQADILAAVKRTGRNTAVLVGLETDVCVAQSAIGLLGEGFQVVVVADATAAPGTAHTFGLERMRGAGVLISSVKGLYYEWVRTVPRNNALGAKYGQELGLPEGIIM